MPVSADGKRFCNLLFAHLPGRIDGASTARLDGHLRFLQLVLFAYYSSTQLNYLEFLDASSAKESSTRLSDRFYPHRASGCNRDHCSADSAPVAGGAVGA